ncbi:MAG TPA: hypothetical protein PK523_11675 [Elusimicrobiales bacterium]|nr:hypothetical protein [Elusimicrobiales bacterium]
MKKTVARPGQDGGTGDHGEGIEPEVVFDGFTRRREPRSRGGELLARVRFLAAAALVLAGLLMLVPGILLSASLIGAVIGVPLMLAGGALLFAGISIGTGRFAVKTFRRR